MGWDASRQAQVSRMINSAYQVFDAIVRCEGMEIGAAFRIRDQTVTDYIRLADADRLTGVVSPTDGRG